MHGRRLVNINKRKRERERELGVLQVMVSNGYLYGILLCWVEVTLYQPTMLTISFLRMEDGSLHFNVDQPASTPLVCSVCLFVCMCVCVCVCVDGSAMSQ